jgi:hypothetical protein
VNPRTSFVFVHSATVEPGHPCTSRLDVHRNFPPTSRVTVLRGEPRCISADILEIRVVSRSISADIWRFAAYLGASRLTSVASAMSSVLTANTAGPLHRRPPGRGAIRVYMSTRCPAHPTLGAHANPTGPHIGCMPLLRIILWHASAPVSVRRYKRRPRRASVHAAHHHPGAWSLAPWSIWFTAAISSSGGLWSLAPMEHLVRSSDRSSDFVLFGQLAMHAPVMREAIRGHRR